MARIPRPLGRGARRFLQRPDRPEHEAAVDRADHVGRDRVAGRGVRRPRRGLGRHLCHRLLLRRGGRRGRTSSPRPSPTRSRVVLVLGAIAALLLWLASTDALGSPRRRSGSTAAAVGLAHHVGLRKMYWVHYRGSSSASASSSCRSGILITAVQYWLFRKGPSGPGSSTRRARRTPRGCACARARHPPFSDHGPATIVQAVVALAMVELDEGPRGHRSRLDRLVLPQDLGFLDRSAHPRGDRHRRPRPARWSASSVAACLPRPVGARSRRSWRSRMRLGAPTAAERPARARALVGASPP